MSISGKIGLSTNGRNNGSVIKTCLLDSRNKGSCQWRQTTKNRREVKEGSKDFSLYSG